MSVISSVDGEQPAPPRVSIGLPVHNGENYLREAIDSILAQSFGNFELIICDNASFDRTEAICRSYALRDPRVRYHRNEHNLGAGPNFNRAFELARGAYFRWAAHDDVLTPTYLERCVEVLDREPDVVLCHSLTRIVGDRGAGMARELAGLDHPRPSARLAAFILRPHACLEIFGLVRAAALRRTGLYRPYCGSDKAIVAELLLQGRCRRIEEPLFVSRDHPQRSMRALSHDQRQVFQNGRNAGRRVLPNLALYLDYARAVPRHVGDRGERRRCCLQLARWWFTDWHAPRVMLDLLCAIDPRIRILAHRAIPALHLNVGPHLFE